MHFIEVVCEGGEGDLGLGVLGWRLSEGQI
jgi:hypothetical protein